MNIYIKEQSIKDPLSHCQARPLKIALFSGNYNYVMDGPVRALNKLVSHLEKKDMNVLVFSPTTKNANFKHAGTLISVPSLALPGRSEYRLGLGIRGSVQKKLEQFDADLFHIAVPDYLGYSALKLAKRWRIPAVSSFHTRFETYLKYYNADWAKEYIIKYMRYFYNSCEHVYAPCKSMAQELAGNSMGKDVRIWSRGVNRSVFNPSMRNIKWRKTLGISDNDIVVGFVGRLVLEKGLDVFVETIKYIENRGINHKILIVGEGPERYALQKRLPKAIFTGFLEGNDLAKAYASSDIFFNPSQTETFGNVTLEAMASGLPCLCANATGSRSLVVNGQNGYLIDPNNVPLYAQTLTKMINNPKYRKLMGNNSYEKSKRYDWDSILESMIKNYRQAILSYQKCQINNLNMQNSLHVPSIVNPAE
ncbi:MAG: glycosyl transferase family 1 [Alphaproteobacteria bacterium TMED87]|nr:glycosyl transferase family 1 [Rhodospirillaceae bacterium]OUV08762.1 MAG: glycosyl transferase family 1 [Alphaproteobacteria bacterium TMED87]